MKNELELVMLNGTEEEILEYLQLCSKREEIQKKIDKITKKYEKSTSK